MTLLQEGGSQLGSSSPLSFTLLGRQRWGGTVFLLKGNTGIQWFYLKILLSLPCLQGVVMLRCEENDQTFPMASDSCSLPFLCLLLPLRQISEEGGVRRERCSKLGPVSCIHLETACLLNSTNFSLPFSCSLHLDETHFWNSSACTNEVHIPLLGRQKGMSGVFIKEERLL